MRRALTLLCLVLPICTAWAGDVYTWKDAAGVTHYSQTPPPSGVRYQLRTVRQDAAETGTRNPSGETPVVPVPTTTPAPDAGSLQAQCALAKDSVAALETDAPVRQAGDDGQLRELSPAERIDQLALARAALRAYCR
ncbi:DUF4124 domain-containing protein [Luteimonas sp. S4-F44]|uniref:DUF4124 domain-containing protein n=1 Tax=Luteimonas sp. S4-F44 TaxID=2925842 RepID=UPI001F530BBA|nr:DUF4124 domain-containing protein [Luteimonas sp. S4-F44]UNK41886.1 DUF4124 domain-containing protein [Luteimonas sp. S4-F44]